MAMVQRTTGDQSDFFRHKIILSLLTIYINIKMIYLNFCEAKRRYLKIVLFCCFRKAALTGLPIEIIRGSETPVVCKAPFMV